MVRDRHLNEMFTVGCVASRAADGQMVVMADTEDPMRLVLVRHGESNATVTRSIGGPRTCTGLSAFGRQQCAGLADRLARTGELAGARLYASHYPRAIQTAELIAPAMGHPDVMVDDGFGEHDPGPDCDGLAFEAFVERYGSPDWESDPYGVTFPGGETLADLHHRVGAAIRRVVDRHPGETVVVCCHGGVVNATMRHALRAPITGDFELFTTNTSLTELRLSRPGRWRLLRYNDTAHLAGLVAEPADTT